MGRLDHYKNPNTTCIYGRIHTDINIHIYIYTVYMSPRNPCPGTSIPSPTPTQATMLLLATEGLFTDCKG